MTTPLQQLQVAFPKWKISFTASNGKYYATRKHVKGLARIKCHGAAMLTRSLHKANFDLFDEKQPCQVCTTGKDKLWHLVCSVCWATVPAADQEELYALYKNERGSERHLLKCHSVLRPLFEARRAAQRLEKAPAAE